MSASSRTDITAVILCMALAFGLFSCGKEKPSESGGREFEIEKKYERGPLALTVKVSRKEITIADRITLILEAVADEEYKVELPKFGEKLEEFGIVDYYNPPPRLIEGGRIVTQKSYELEPFLSGDYKIPPMKVVFWKKGEEESKKHEMETEELTVTVKSILPEKRAELKIKDIAPPVELPRTRRAWLYTAVAGGVIGIMVMGALIFWLRRRRTEAAMSLTVPAHEVAYHQLKKLLAEKLVEKGQVKLFYTRISDILRHYIENRWCLRAPEMTTEEFLEKLGDSEVLGAEHKALLKDFLSHCDLVKFAELEPTKAEIQKTFDACKDFIAATASEERAVELAPLAV